MFCDRKISGFVNVNRVIAHVCDGGTLAKMPRLCGALSEAKGKGGGVQGACSKVNRGMGKVAIFWVVAIFLLQMGCSNTTTHQEFYSSGELWKERTYYSRDTSAYLEKTYFRNGQLKSSGSYVSSKRNGIWQGWFSGGAKHWEAEYANGTPKPVPEDPFISLGVLGTDSAWTWHVDMPLYLQVYIEGATPYNANVACYCDFILPIDTIDHNFSIGVIPRKQGAMMFEIIFLEDGKYYSIGQDTIYVFPSSNHIGDIYLNFEEVEDEVFTPPMNEK